MTATQRPVDPAMNENEERVEDAPTEKIDGRCRVEATPRLAPEERRKRQDAVRFANASMALEGFSISAEEHLRADRFIAGEIDLAEFLRGG
jgi:hypothetical protein